MHGKFGNLIGAIGGLGFKPIYDLKTPKDAFAYGCWEVHLLAAIVLKLLLELN